MIFPSYYPDPLKDMEGGADFVFEGLASIEEFEKALEAIFGRGPVPAGRLYCNPEKY
jgi:hypothetical protein